MQALYHIPCTTVSKLPCVPCSILGSVCRSIFAATFATRISLCRCLPAYFAHFFEAFLRAMFKSGNISPNHFLQYHPHLTLAFLGGPHFAHGNFFRADFDADVGSTSLSLSTASRFLLRAGTTGRFLTVVRDRGMALPRIFVVPKLLQRD